MTTYPRPQDVSSPCMAAHHQHLTMARALFGDGGSSGYPLPGKAPELLAYQALIIQAERNYEGHQWAAYDRQYCREALSRRDLNWSVPDPRLYNEVFTGRARSIPRCTYCL